MNNLKHKIHEIIFEADTPAGKWFDIALLILIFFSVVATMLESVESISAKYGKLLYTIEWILTIAFTLEYLLRIYVTKQKTGYIFSFFGIVDLLSIIPTYLSLLFVGSQAFAVIRALRLLRVFRVLKMVHFLKEYNVLIAALRASRIKILVFLGAIVIIVCIIGSSMYLIETNQNSGFNNIPVSIYWAVVTLTTVGYGDITPVTPLGQFFSACLMILGYAIIAVPTGIVSAELVQIENNKENINTLTCKNCSHEGHEDDAKFCKFCGYTL